MLTSAHRNTTEQPLENTSLNSPGPAASAFTASLPAEPSEFAVSRCDPERPYCCSLARTLSACPRYTTTTPRASRLRALTPSSAAPATPSSYRPGKLSGRLRMRYLWTPSLPAAWSVQSDGPTRTWKWNKCEVEAQMGNPEFPDWTPGFTGEMANWRPGSQISRTASCPQPARDRNRSRWRGGELERRRGVRTFHGEKRASCLVRGQSSRFSLAVTGAAGAGIALPELLRLPVAGWQSGSAPPLPHHRHGRRERARVVF